MAVAESAVFGVCASKRLRTGDASTAGFWQNFSKMLLVFGCIGIDFCKKKYTSASRKRVTHKGERRLRDNKLEF